MYRYSAIRQSTSLIASTGTILVKRKKVKMSTGYKWETSSQNALQRLFWGGGVHKGNEQLICFLFVIFG